MSILWNKSRLRLRLMKNRVYKLKSLVKFGDVFFKHDSVECPESMLNNDRFIQDIVTTTQQMMIPKIFCIFHPVSIMSRFNRGKFAHIGHQIIQWHQHQSLECFSCRHSSIGQVRKVAHLGGRPLRQGASRCDQAFVPAKWLDGRR